VLSFISKVLHHSRHRENTMDTRTLTQKNTPAFVERDPNLVDTIQTLDGLSSLVGLTTSETLPVIVDHFDPQAKELVCHVEFIPPWLGSIKKEIRIPLSRIAWASAFVEEIKAEALEAWGYENLESGLAEATAEKYGFSVRTIEDSVPQVRTAPIRIQPPDNRCVRLISGIPVYFDWNWLDRIDLLNERIDEPMPQFPSTVDTAAADGVTTGASADGRAFSRRFRFILWTVLTGRLRL